LALSPGHSGGVASARRDQWDIIHGRLVGKRFAPLLLRLTMRVDVLPAQQAQPAPCIAVMMAALGGPPTGRVVEMGR
jgi:hypothetical protein